MFKILPIIFLLFLSGCTLIPVKNSTFEKQKKEIATLQTQQQQLIQEKKDLEKKYNDAIKGKQSEIQNSESNRISVGGAQAIAVLGTLNAEPNKTKYTDAGIKGLKVTKDALQDKVKTKDLLLAIDTQNNLISDQAAQIAEGNKTIDQLHAEISGLKQNENKLKSEIQTISKEKQQELAKKDEEIKKKDGVIGQRQEDLKKKEEIINNINAEKAKEFDKQNSFWSKINPFTHLSKFFSSIFVWIIVFVAFGLVLKICSIFFPGVNVLQVIVKGIGSFVGGILKLIFGAIPNLFHGLGAVDKKEYDKEKTIANNLVGSIQEMKYEKPEIYKAELKEKLIDWFKDSPELEAEVEKKLKELNLK